MSWTSSNPDSGKTNIKCIRNRNLAMRHGIKPSPVADQIYVSDRNIKVLIQSLTTHLLLLSLKRPNYTFHFPHVFLGFTPKTSRQASSESCSLGTHIWSVGRPSWVWDSSTGLSLQFSQGEWCWGGGAKLPHWRLHRIYIEQNLLGTFQISNTVQGETDVPSSYMLWSQYEWGCHTRWNSQLLSSWQSKCGTQTQSMRKGDM